MPPRRRELNVTLGGQSFAVGVVVRSDGSYAVKVDETDVIVRPDAFPGGVRMLIGPLVLETWRSKRPEVHVTSAAGSSVRAMVDVATVGHPRGRSGASAPGDADVRSPMPGRVVTVRVASGDHVVANQPLIVIEAMKMENELRARVPGRVESVAVEAGDNVEKNTLLMRIVSEPHTP
jgi:biotin carboxyl carrier protein